MITPFINDLQFSFVLGVEDFLPDHLDIHGRPKALASVFHLPQAIGHKRPKGEEDDKDNALHGRVCAGSLLSPGGNNQLLTDLQFGWIQTRIGGI